MTCLTSVISKGTCANDTSTARSRITARHLVKRVEGLQICPERHACNAARFRYFSVDKLGLVYLGFRQDARQVSQSAMSENLSAYGEKQSIQWNTLIGRVCRKGTFCRYAGTEWFLGQTVRKNRYGAFAVQRQPMITFQSRSCLQHILGSPSFVKNLFVLHLLTQDCRKEGRQVCRKWKICWVVEESFNSTEIELSNTLDYTRF